MKKNLTVDKDSPLITNDGYLVSGWFCNPLNVKKEINMAG